MLIESYLAENNWDAELRTNKKVDSLVLMVDLLEHYQLSGKEKKIHL